mmetsp:Transcript_66112/g.158161  ORF Transcript_66112/g.158161 Transcript_66112/m.158161 type:complete len:199 (-) Transcript_66112:46-642(-)
MNPCAGLDARVAASTAFSLELDRLFREVHGQVHANDVARSQHGLSQDSLEIQVAAAQERLKAARQRNAGLADRARALENVLLHCRARYALRTGAGFDPRPIPGDLALDAEDSLLHSFLASGDAAAADVRDALGEELVSFIERLPTSPKPPARGRLCELLNACYSGAMEAPSLLPDNAPADLTVPSDLATAGRGSLVAK